MCNQKGSTSADRSCPNKAHMGEFACQNRQQCFEPCGALGHSEEHAVAVPLPEIKAAFANG